MARSHADAATADNDYAGRRLVVVAAFDVVNFSALVEADEENVLAAWRRLRREIDPLIAANGGRIFKSLGDGLLVEFSSPVAATRAALAVQDRTAKFTPERGLRLRLRCAIHMGQVTVEGTDLLGDGINVVSRLQQHAPTGGVLVSAAVMDLIGGLIDAPIKDLGILKLRNISRPVHAYTVGAGKRPRTTPAIDSFQRRRPSIAVLPFIDQAAEAAASYFSDGLVEDIIAGLACLPELVVISRSSTLRYRGSTPDPRQVRRDLRVRYMLSGTVRRVPSPTPNSTGDTVRLSAELTDCESGARIWSDRFAGEAADIFALQDDLSARVVATIAPQVQESELRRVLRKRPESLDAYECVLRGLDLMYHFESEQFDEARKMFERAMALDPKYATAHALAANWYSMRIHQGRSSDVRADMTEADRLSRLALALDRFDPLALSTSGHVRAFLFRDYDHALELFDRALTANPSSAIAWLRSSATFSFIGETREAKRRGEIGLRLSPHDAHVFFGYATMALAAYAAGDYDETVRWARRSAALNPRFTANLRFLAAGLAASGKAEEAHVAAETLLRFEPKFSARRFAEGHAFKDPEMRLRFSDHLVLAGLPE